MTIYLIFTLALLATAGLGVHKSMKNDANLNDLALSNVEALASGEIGYPCKWRTDYINGSWFAICDEIGIGYDCTCGEVKPYY
jgi:hypothetical protein